MTGPGSSCGACKFLRRKCTRECVFAPYFSYEEAAAHFAAVHKVFGASNVSKMLLHIPVDYRTEAAVTISYEALARMTDPVFGCVAHIFALHQQEEIELLGSQLAAGYPFTLPGSQPTENLSINQEAFNLQQQVEEVPADIIYTGYGNGAPADQSCTVTQLPVVCRVETASSAVINYDSYYPATEINGGSDHEAQLFFPLLNNNNSQYE
ncbi:hypothetical protein QQ045_031584 [Rhodiola kirilowii]